MIDYNNWNQTVTVFDPLPDDELPCGCEFKKSVVEKLDGILIEEL